MAEEEKIIDIIKKKKKKKGMTSKAKKKNAVANAVIRKGTGTVRINKRNIDSIGPDYVQEFIKEPLELAGETAGEVDIEVTVKGGGFMGQSVASRAAIAKALLDFRRGDEKLKKKFLAYDRMLLVDDARRVEPKKQLGPKARAKKQASKR
ncbi:MAG: 30S ribosomal protein S9 [archaeon]|nr:30S ribosomal protein S9 [archaeon]